LPAIAASIVKMVSSITTENKDRDVRGVAMWKSMLKKQDVKIGPEREKVEAAKMEAQAGMMKAMNETSNIALSKMTQQAKILMENLSNTEPLARAR
jgi:hypothetical protein